MELPFLNAVRKRDQLISVDLGGRRSKAAYLERRGNGFALVGYAVIDAPIYDKTISAEMLSDHLKQICEQLSPKTKAVTLSVGPGEALVRHTDLPQMPVSDMRQVLKAAPKTYLQQDLPNHIFDCYVMPPRVDAKSGEAAKTGGSNTKFRVLVAGAKDQFVNTVQTASKAAGLMTENLVPGVVGPVNAFEAAMPQVFSKENVALVDIGFRHTTVCILEQGELALSRVVAIGGDRVTSGLAEALGISYAEAEGIKIGMPQEVEAHLESMLVPLGRELRASIDFFEHQRDKAVSQVYVCGGTARSEFILGILQRELMLECKTWNPLENLELALTPIQRAEIEQAGHQLTTAIGAAFATF